MNIHIAAHYLKQGFRIRRSSWQPKNYISYIYDSMLVKSSFYEDRVGHSYNDLDLEELLADDWVTITEGIVSYNPMRYEND